MQHEEIEHRKHRQIFAQNPDKIDRKRLSLKSPPPILGTIFQWKHTKS